jgi:DNA-binding response OmpR family regulator
MTQRVSHEADFVGDAFPDTGTRRRAVGHRVLVVDDHEDIATLYATVLRADGFEVDYTTHPNQALSLALARHPEVITLDLAMPEMDGCELARLVRSYATTRNTRLIAVSAHGFNFARYQVPPGGWDACIRKPCDPVALIATVRAVLDTRWVGKRVPITIPVGLDGTGGEE